MSCLRVSGSSEADIQMPDRDKAKAALQQALEFTFKRTLTGREVWAHWGRSEAGKDRVGMLFKIASALEEDVVHTTLTKKDFGKLPSSEA